MTTTFESAKKKLATLWFVSSGIIFLIMLTQTISGKFDNHLGDAWGWFIQSLMPTLSLVCTIFAFDTEDVPTSVRIVDPFHFRAAFSVSLFYLIVLLVVILAIGITKTPWVLWLKQSSHYLAVFQGILSVAVGMFFIKKKA